MTVDLCCDFCCSSWAMISLCFFSGGRHSSISRVSSWLESYMKMPKHTTLLLLRAKFSVSDSMFLFVIIRTKITLYLVHDMLHFIQAEILMGSILHFRDRCRRHLAVVWEDVFWILPRVGLRHHPARAGIKCSWIPAGRLELKGEFHWFYTWINISSIIL